MSQEALKLSQDIENIRNQVEAAWDVRNEINTSTRGEKRSAVEHALELLDRGEIRVAQQTESGWQVNDWVKKAILLSFRLNESQVIGGGPVSGATPSMWYDKVPSKFAGWNDLKFIQAGFRAVPGCFVRKGSYIARDVVLMPSFVNIGAYVDSGTMVDTWATIGSCAQIGKNCHISGGAGIGGVLEPLQASPVIIEDDCFIGARAEIAEGVIVEKGAVISMGVYIGASTKVIDRETGEVFFGRVPENAVVVPGNMPGKPLPDGSMGPSLYCAVIVKRADEKTRSKTSINEILRSL